MFEHLYSILQQTLTITAFVIGMMMIIEFINVKTDGLWSKKLQASPWMQILIGALMGVIPGCLGTYTIVSLYIHRVVNFPALMAALIATAGDEAFFMFSMFPGKALTITLIMFVAAIVVGAILQLVMKDKYIGLTEKSFPLHDEPECHHHHEHTMKNNLKNITFVRALLIAMCVLVLGLILGGVIDEGHEHGHEHGGDEEWIRYSLIAMFSVILVIVAVAKEHFLQEHLWEHVIKVHLPKIFLWSFGVILVITLLEEYVDLEGLVNANPYIVLLIAVLIGIIPQSGPHLVFVLLFANGTLPFSILLANSIVQDGHGALPLLAESRKAFLLSKGIKIGLGVAVGIAGLLIGF
ncbi:MAG: arsenic efflux protein [Bacteroidales bacterium]|nr:arsenic efflux protein [Bacteroidales bacterium]MBQ7532336.1 arsenic efflux protein [Bacteroidales bacterium]